MKKLDRKNLYLIEKRLNKMKYEQIPQEFINIVDEKFDTYSYLKSLIELTKDF